MGTGIGSSLNRAINGELSETNAGEKKEANVDWFWGWIVWKIIICN